MSTPYNFSQVHRSLVASICILGLGSLAFLWNGVWLSSPIQGLGFLFDDCWFRLPKSGAMSTGWVATLVAGANAFCAVTFILLPLLCGLIGTYRGASKLRLPGHVVGLLLIPSLFPPTALITQIVLLAKVNQAIKSAGNLAAKFAPRGSADDSRGPQWPWVSAAACLLIYLILQLSVISLPGRAKELNDKLAKLQQEGTQALIQTLNYGGNWEAVGHEIRRQRESIESQLENMEQTHDSAVHASNFAFLAVLCFAAAWTVTDLAASRRLVIRNERGGGNPLAARPLTPGASGMPAGDEGTGREFFLIRNGERCGPYSQSVIGSLIASEVVSETDVCWTEGWEDWRPIAEAFGPAAGIQPTPSKPAVKWTLKQTGQKEAKENEQN